MTVSGQAEESRAADISAPGQTAPFAPFEWMLASRYLRARRKEGFISVIAGFSFLGIMLGVATLIIVMAVMNGFRKDLFSKILGLNGHVIVHKIGEPFTDYTDIISKISAVPGVKGVLPGRGTGHGVVQRQRRRRPGARDHGKRHQRVAARRQQHPVRLDSDGFDGQSGIAIGSRLAASLRVTLGDQITIITPRGATTPFGTAPRTKQYTVMSIFELGMSEYDRTMILMPLHEAQRFFGKLDEVDVLEVVVDDPEKAGVYVRPREDRRWPDRANVGLEPAQRDVRQRARRSSATSCSSSCR